MAYYYAILWYCEDKLFFFSEFVKPYFAFVHYKILHDNVHVFQIVCTVPSFENPINVFPSRILQNSRDALVRPFLYFDHSNSISLSDLLRPFVKSGFLIGREAQVEVLFCSKEIFLYFDHFHIFDLFCLSTHRLYFDLNLTSTFLLQFYFDRNFTSTFT